jgi:hypothetical protein
MGYVDFFLHFVTFIIMSRSNRVGLHSDSPDKRKDNDSKKRRRPDYYYQYSSTPSFRRESFEKPCVSDADCDAGRLEACDPGSSACRVCFPPGLCGKTMGENCASDFHCSGEPGLACRLWTCVCRWGALDGPGGSQR